VRAIPSSYSEEGELRQDASFYKVFTGSTASTGIDREAFNLPSLSMTDFPEAAPVMIFSATAARTLSGEGNLYGSHFFWNTDEQETEINLEKFVWLWRESKGLEWTGLYTRLPEKLREQLEALNQEKREDRLYDIADEIARWLRDASRAEQSVFSNYVTRLIPTAVRILISAIADSEVQLSSGRLLYTIAGFLGSEDKRVAQSAAICLLQCGSGVGGALLRDRVNRPASLPHVQLILGTINLLTSK
jgi:hypothetical protein